MESPYVSSPSVPAYLRIVNTVSERLASGVYSTGSRLPSQSQFCAEFGVSHMTLRRALAILADKGLISAERGRGTFARSFDLGDSVFAMKQLAGQWLNGPTEVRLLSASTIGASNKVARMLAVSRGDRVVYLRQLVLSDGIPAIYHREYVLYDPCQPLVELLLQSTSLHGLLQTAGGERFPRARITLRASALGAAAARILDEPPTAPALCIEHLFQDTDSRPLSWGCFLLRADLFTLHAFLGPWLTGGREEAQPKAETQRANSIQRRQEV